MRDHFAEEVSTILGDGGIEGRYFKRSTVLSLRSTYMHFNVAIST